MLDFRKKSESFQWDGAELFERATYIWPRYVFHTLLNFTLRGPRNWQGFSQWEHALKNTHWLILKSDLHVGWEAENLLLHCCLPWLFGMCSTELDFNQSLLNWPLRKSLPLLWSWSSPAVRASALSLSAWLCHLTGLRTAGPSLLSDSWHYCRLVEMQYANTMGHGKSGEHKFRFSLVLKWSHV